MNFIRLMFLIVAILGGIGFVASSLSNSGNAKTTSSSGATNDAEEKRHRMAVAAMRTIIKSLRDPESVKWDSVMVSSDASLVCVEYRAKNGFGGYTFERVLFKNMAPSQKADDWNRLCARTPLHNNTYSANAL